MELQHTLKLSDILAIMIRDKNNFTCHAIIKHAAECVDKRIAWSKGYRVSESDYLDALAIIAPNNFKKCEFPGFQILYWVKNMPGHLRYKTELFGDQHHNYRVKLLKWMINKFGDHTITVKIVKYF